MSPNFDVSRTSANFVERLLDDFGGKAPECFTVKAIERRTVLTHRHNRFDIDATRPLARLAQASDPNVRFWPVRPDDSRTLSAEDDRGRACSPLRIALTGIWPGCDGVGVGRESASSFRR